jgi:hypothetical protein
MDAALARELAFRKAQQEWDEEVRRRKAVLNMQRRATDDMALARRTERPAGAYAPDTRAGLPVGVYVALERAEARAREGVVEQWAVGVNDCVACADVSWAEGAVGR